MTTITTQRLRGRPAHPTGPTVLTYTPNGRKLITAGSNNVIRVYTTGSDGEPTNIDDCQENNTAIAATNDFFITGSEDGMVCMYSLETCLYEKLLTRYTLPIRDIALSPDGKWAAIASDELTVKVVNIEDMTRVLYLRDQPKSAKHLMFDPSGTYLAVSCIDGIIYIYSLSTEEPELLRKVDGIIQALEPDSEISSKAVWHPDGRAFAAPTATRDVMVVSRNDGEKQRAFKDGHLGMITAVAWSPNGAILATAGAEGFVLLWETKTQKVLARYEYQGVTNIAWHSHENIVSFTTSEGELFIYADFVPSQHTGLLEIVLQPTPFLHQPLTEVSGNERRGLANGTKLIEEPRKRQGTPDSLDDILGSEGGYGDEDDFVVDDDGAGYALGLNQNGKRGHGDLDNELAPLSKRRAGDATWNVRVHPVIQPGSTPWRGNRRYLCLNLTGFVWTVDQDTHHTVTVEFHDREEHRGFHFTDPYLYDKACLNESGTLFACSPANGNPAMLFYRPHETWTTRSDWRTHLPAGEDITSISLSNSYIIATTTASYLRVYTLHGTPVRISRLKSSPTVTCASWHDYVLTVANGALSSTGSPQLLYTLENIARDDVLQSEDTVALPPNTTLKSVFFSDAGDPCVYDSSGVLLVLLHWRTPGQARWMPLLDTKGLDRLRGGRKEETYWPVAVAQERFHCIILKGGDQHPYFPRPLLSEFEFKIPVSSLPAPERPASPSSSPVPGEAEAPKLEAAYLLSSLLTTLHADLLQGTHSTASQRADLARKEVEVDKILLQMLNVECREGEERGEKCLEIVKLLRDRSGRMVEAAQKVAGRYGRSVLMGKIREVGEALLMGEEDED